MSLWSRKELEEIFTCKLPDNFSVEGISIDSRTLVSGDLFFALKAGQSDGHNYVLDAASKGASAVVVSHLIPNCSCPQILVDDTFKALNDLGRYGRLRSKAKIIAITGSVGKTTAKEVLLQTLSAFGTVSASVASYNNHWGVPLSLARLPKDTKFGIFEIGMNHPGEITPLAQMVNPHVAIITAIAPAHIGQMGNLENIAKEKACIFDGLAEDGVAIIPDSSEFTSLLRQKAMARHPERVYIFGNQDSSDVKLVGYDLVDGQAKLTIGLGQKDKVNVNFALLGQHLANSALIALALSKALRLDVQKTIAKLSVIQPIDGRGRIHKVLLENREVSLFDDSYNANLSSALAAVKTLSTISPSKEGRRIAVLGEMLELGSFALDHHAQLIKSCLSMNIDKIYLCGGSVMEQAYAIVPEENRGAYFRVAQDLIPIVLKDVGDGDIVLVKGSKGSRVSCVAESILKQNQKRG